VRRAPQGSPSAATSRSRSLPRALAKLGLACAAVAALVGVGSPAASAACPNEAFRVGPSAQLPDCRAYELVTPPDNNRIFYAGTGNGGGPVKFSSPPVTPSGDGYLFTLFATSAPDLPSVGGGNLIEARRTGDGWVPAFLSPSVSQAEISIPGSADSSHQYVTFQVEDTRGGSLAALADCACGNSSWVRYPDGSFHPLGEGTVSTDTDTDGYENGLVDDLNAQASWFASGGTDRVFEANIEMISGGPSTNQVYDRTPAGLSLMSVLPGDTPPATPSRFAGSSADASVILFVNNSDLYARIDGSETVKVASSADGAFVPGGVDAMGTKVFYVQEGDISYYDVEAEENKEVVSTGNAVLAYVSPDGSHVYFLSEEELNPGEGMLGEPNLYVWDGSSVKFIGTVTAEDVAHSENAGIPPFAGLELWAEREVEQPKPLAQNKNFLTVTARSTFDGTVIVFESRAQLTSVPTAGHAEIYRYDTEADTLTCVSCSPEAAATADSNLVFLQNEGALKTLYPTVEIANLSADGKKIVFESKDALLSDDVNGVRDVYQWDEGTLSLISTGGASFPSAVVGVSPSGDDIFFQTAEKLVSRGQNPGTYAIYDARVNGGLASQQATPSLECQAEGCLEMPNAPPSLAAPGSSQLRGKGNLRGRCRGQHKRKQHQKKTRTNRPHPKKKSCKSKGRRATK
jgi:WD40 repeat protein